MFLLGRRATMVKACVERTNTEHPKIIPWREQRIQYKRGQIHPSCVGYNPKNMNIARLCKWIYTAILLCLGLPRNHPTPFARCTAFHSAKVEDAFFCIHKGTLWKLSRLPSFKIPPWFLVELENGEAQK